MKESIQESLKLGVPYSDFDNASQEFLNELVWLADQASLEARGTLYAKHAAGSDEVVVFGDEDSGEEEKFISFRDEQGRPCYFRWDKDRPATDIGIRGINPDYNKPSNLSTIIHADRDAVDHLAGRGAPGVLINALESVAAVNQFVVSQYARPLLRSIAEAAGIDPDEYINIFYPEGLRNCTLTRNILYHLGEQSANVRPVGRDGTPLLIKEHYDQSAYTFDVHQSGPGLQHHYEDAWQDAGTNIAFFRGAADDYLPEPTPPVLHRAVAEKESDNHWAKHLRSRGIGRTAIITFISPSVDGARVVRPSSLETQPTAVSHHP